MNGQNRNTNATRTDGATNVNIWLPHHKMYVSPAETIDTVNISTNNFDAEQGMAGGAAITVITKSGTNKFKGSAFEFYNNEKLNATRTTSAACARRASRTSHPSTATSSAARVGGPIKKNKLFFFGSFEGYKQTQTGQPVLQRAERGACAPATSAARSTPTARSRSSTTRSRATPTARAARRSRTTSFPPNRINPIAKQLLGAVPAAEQRRLRRRRL